jgi:hypothetical protein
VHTYVFRVAQSAQWHGLINRLRLDPCSAKGALVTTDPIRLGG